MDAKGVIARVRSLPGQVATRLSLRRRSSRLAQVPDTFLAKGRAVSQSGLATRFRDRASNAVNRVGAAIGPKVEGAINRELLQELEAEVETLRRQVDLLTRERDAERAARAAAEARLAAVGAGPTDTDPPPTRRGRSRSPSPPSKKPPRQET